MEDAFIYEEEDISAKLLYRRPLLLKLMAELRERDVMTKKHFCDKHERLWDHSMTRYMDMLVGKGYVEIVSYSPKKWRANRKLNDLDFEELKL